MSWNRSHRTVGTWYSDRQCHVLCGIVSTSRWLNKIDRWNWNGIDSNILWAENKYPRYRYRYLEFESDLNGGMDIFHIYLSSNTIFWCPCIFRIKDIITYLANPCFYRQSMDCNAGRNDAFVSILKYFIGLLIADTTRIFNFYFLMNQVDALRNNFGSK